MKKIKTDKLLLLGAAGFAIYWLFLRKPGESSGSGYLTTTPGYFWDRYFGGDWTTPAGGYNPTGQPGGRFVFNEWGLPTYESPNIAP